MGGGISLQQSSTTNQINGQPEFLKREMPEVEYHPPEIVRYRTAQWRGVQAKAVQIISHEPFEYIFEKPYHLLIAIEQGLGMTEKRPLRDCRHQRRATTPAS
jgi:hypothetical protein